MKWISTDISKAKEELFPQSVTTNLWVILKHLPIPVVQHHALHLSQVLDFLLQYFLLREDDQHLFVIHQHLLYNHHL